MSKRSEQQKRHAIRILNAGDGPGYTSAKNAIKYLKRGQARYVDENTIEMVGYRHESVLASIASGYTAPNRRPQRMHVPTLDEVREMEGIQDSGLECIGLQWPLRELGTPGKSVAA